MKKERQKKIGKLWNVILAGNRLKITKYNRETSQFDVKFNHDYKTSRPDLYSNINSVKKIKDFIKKYKND